MSQTMKILIAAATLLLYASGPVFLIFWFGFIGYMATQPPGAQPPVALLIGLVAFWALVMLWWLGLLATYLVHLFKTDRVPQDTKALWAVVLILAGIWAMAVYWYLYIWREPGSAAPSVA